MTGPRDVVPDDLDAPFWDACLRSEFLVQRCGGCGRAYWPASSCPQHGAASMRWEPASGRGTVHTWTVYHHAYDRELADRVPYVLAVVELAEGPFFHTDLVGCDPADVRVGLPVEVVYDTVRPDVVVPRFRPCESPDEPGASYDEGND
ncbi:Zn-ribbon domain-containing OB-fold protein [Cryptosporangium aurantiacum]|uniref:DUF35 domain-containing protein n=1 Tax=Cryptosporangium aurantiacum TaxID=134849 RepID=A0A1M7TYI6_9ACTN|nr:OB-fold domain-containing protein [Cryptosporangium aurantiacum]SHN75768.1 hypothetical protein SAMN05443668_107375 [Cryptosporangium aurantiacum]